MLIMDTGKGFRGLRLKTGPGMLQLLFVFSLLTVFHNIDEVLGGFFLPENLRLELVDQGPPCFAISNGFLVVVAAVVHFLNGFAICADQKMC